MVDLLKQFALKYVNFGNAIASLLMSFVLNFLNLEYFGQLKGTCEVICHSILAVLAIVIELEVSLQLSDVVGKTAKNNKLYGRWLFNSSELHY